MKKELLKEGDIVTFNFVDKQLQTNTYKITDLLHDKPGHIKVLDPIYMEEQYMPIKDIKEIVRSV